MENTLEKMTLELTLPSERYKSSYIEALKEFVEEDGDRDGVNIEEREQNFDAFLQKLKDDGTLNDGDKVPNIQYWLVEGDKYIGRINYRPQLNDQLRFRGGNIGYAVRPSERGKGYATMMLNQILNKAKSDGLTEVLLTCDTDNVPSIKTIEKGGGILVGTDVDDNGVSFNRYKIQL